MGELVSAAGTLMIEGLELTNREKRVLTSLVLGQAMDPVSRYFQRPLKGARGILESVVVGILAIGFGYGMFIMIYRLDSDIMFSALFLFVVVEKFVQVPVRERLIRKLYGALQVHEGGRPTPAAQADQKGSLSGS